MKKNYIKMNRILFAVIIMFIAACGGGSSNRQTTTESKTTESSVPDPNEPPAEVNDLLNKYTCLTCHSAADKIVGPAFAEVAKRKYTDDEIIGLIAKPKPEHWPDYPPMLGLKVPEADARKIAQWINSLHKQ